MHQPNCVGVIIYEMPLKNEVKDKPQKWRSWNYWNPTFSMVSNLPRNLSLWSQAAQVLTCFEKCGSLINVDFCEKESSTLCDHPWTSFDSSASKFGSNPVNFSFTIAGLFIHFFIHSLWIIDQLKILAVGWDRDLNCSGINHNITSNS